MPSPSMFWMWNDTNLMMSQVNRLAQVPGDKTVLVKAVDGDHVFDSRGRPGICQWSDVIVEMFMGVGCKVGLWTFNYGTGPVGYDRPHTVNAELAALDDALSRSQYKPSTICLNIETQIMGGNNPHSEVEDLVFGARMRSGQDCPVGVSTVWHWANSMGWPFQAALNGGVDYWSNQVYGLDWQSYRAYDALYSRLSGGLPDYISVPGNGDDPYAMGAWGVWAKAHGAPGVNWWTLEDINTEAKWQTVDFVARDIFGAVSPPNDENAQLQAEADRIGLGDNRHKSWYDRPYYHGNVLFTDRGIAGHNQEETERIMRGGMDDLITWLEQNAYSGRYKGPGE